MASSQFLTQLQQLPPEARQAMSACFGTILTELNQSAMTTQTIATTNGATKPRGRRPKQQLHTQSAGTVGEVVAIKRRGANKRKLLGASPQAQS